MALTSINNPCKGICVGGPHHGTTLVFDGEPDRSILLPTAIAITPSYIEYSIEDTTLTKVYAAKYVRTFKTNKDNIYILEYVGMQ